MASEGSLQKLKVLNADKSGKEVIFEAQFNPTEISFSKRISWNEQFVKGQDMPYVSFDSGEGETFDMTLFLDTTSNPNDDVYQKYTSKIDMMGEVDVEKHRPPLLHIIWGEIFLMQCVLTNIDYDFSLFNKNGRAVRGTAKLSFKQIVAFDKGDSAKVTKGEKQSPDHTKVRTLRQGDSLQSIAHVEYEDVRMWKILAEHNNIDDPLNIPVGTIIEIPAL